MCGIFALLNSEPILTNKYINDQFQKGSKRGPEFSILKNVMIKTLFGFHRLAINGLNEQSNQPLIVGDIALICNGEIYNYKELYKELDVEPISGSDCEIIIYLYTLYGIEQTLQMLDGVFSFVLMDYRNHTGDAKIYVARDPYGVRPLYVLKNTRNDVDGIISFASELKVLSDMCIKLNEIGKHGDSLNKISINGLQNFLYSEEYNANLPYKIEQFEPGTYSIYNLNISIISDWKLENEYIKYHSTGFSSNVYLHSPADFFDMNYALKNIQYYLMNAVKKRCCTTERQIACLLSGGLDSSLICALVNEFHKTYELPTLETYSIGLAGSEDLKYARIAADYLGTKHTEVVLTEQDFLDAIPDVIKMIESYDTTSVRASIGNWLLGKYISEHSEAKVIFNGDGSDELCGGYLYMHKAPDNIEFDKECRRLLKDIHAFDVLRSDKSISSHGLEPRTPFLDRNWVQFYLSLPIQLRNHNVSKNCEKFLLRYAFSSKNYQNINGEPLLPDVILWRKKEAFSDGVSKTSRSLYQIIQEFTRKQFFSCDSEERAYTHINDYPEELIAGICSINPEMFGINGHLMPKTSEQYYYRKIFEQCYPGMGKIVPYFWMPKYVNATDASARTLDIYNDEA